MNANRVHRTGQALVLATGIIIALAATTTLLLWNGDELVEYWYYFLPGAAVLYGIAAACILGPAKRWTLPAPDPRKARATLVSAAIVTGLLASAVGWVAWDQLVPKPLALHPREFSIEYDPAFSFATQFGDLNQTVETLYATILASANPTSPDGYAWGESYVVRGFINTYMATGDQACLWRLLNRTDAIHDNRDRNGDGVPGYGTAGYTGGVYVEYIVWDGVILAPLAKVANIIKNDPALWSNASLQAKAIAYMDTCEAVIRKWNATHWFEPGDGTGYYVSPPQNTTAIFNRINAFGLLTMQVHDYTGNATYRSMVTKMARFFKQYLVIRAYTMDGQAKEMHTWGYDWRGDNSDTSHACIDVEFAIACHERGIVFTTTDMRRFASTFVDFVYRGRPWQTAALEPVGDQDPPVHVNHTNTFADMVNGRTGGDNHYLSLREGWFQLYRYHENVSLAGFVVALSLADLVRAMPTRPPYHTSLGVTYFQCLAAIRCMAYIDGEPLAAWF